MNRRIRVSLVLAVAFSLGGCDGPTYAPANLRHLEVAGFSLDMTNAQVAEKLRRDGTWSEVFCDGVFSLDRSRPVAPASTEVAGTAVPADVVVRPDSSDQTIEKDAIRYCGARAPGKSLHVIGQMGPIPRDGPAPQNYAIHYRVEYNEEHSVKKIAETLIEKYGTPTEASIAVDYSFAHLTWRTAYTWRAAYGLLRTFGTSEYPSLSLEIWVQPKEVTFDLRDVEAFTGDLARYKSVVIEQEETRKQTGSQKEPLQF
jgi:hypothetical protein